jgi:hypothetical protein
MKQVFVLQNQHNQFLNKQGEWCDGREAKTLYNTEFKDEAINQQFEVSSKDYTLRVTLLRCKLDERRIPQIPSDNLPDAMEMPIEPACAADEPSALDEEPLALDEEPSALDEEPSALDEKSSALDEEIPAQDNEPQASLLDDLLVEEPSVQDKEPSAVSEEPLSSTEEAEAIVETVVAEVSTVADMFVGHDEVGAANDAPTPEGFGLESAQPQTEE